MGAILLHAPRWLVITVAACVVVTANVAIGMGAAVGERGLLLTLSFGLLPALLIAFGRLVESHRATLAWLALAMNLTGVGFFTQQLPLPGGALIYPTDVILLVAFGAWLASRLTGVPVQHAVRLSPAFGWPLALLSVTVISGIATGHERYGVNIVGEPLRIVLYAAIALALTDSSVASAWRAITIVFYVGAIVQSLWALYYLATGTSQTASAVLTTGGVRVLALSVAIYLTGSLVCALLNLELERRPERQLLHLGIACLALFGIVVSFGRTTYAAVALIVPLLLLTRRYLRRNVLVLAPLLAPVVAIGLLLVPSVAPSLGSTLQARLSGTSTNDGAVVWRERARDAALEGVDKEWLTGVGFGREVEFTTLERSVVKLRGDPHNSYVWILAGGGVLALGSFLLLCATYVIDAGRRLRSRQPQDQALIVWSLATWFAFMVNAVAGPILSNPTLLVSVWILMALPSLVALQRPRDAAA